MFLSTLLLLFALVELVFSKWANSLCLVASAFFDLTDAAVLLVGVWGKTLTRDRRPTLVYSYGFERYEVILKFGAASYFAFVCLWIFFEGIERILEVRELALVVLREGYVNLNNSSILPRSSQHLSMATC